MRLALLSIVPALLLAQTRPLVIQGVTVVNLEGGTSETLSLLIENGRIRSIVPAGRLTVPARAQVIQGSGKYLLPGLWDMHVHLWHDRAVLPLYVRHGVTGVRDMGSDVNRTQQWRQDILAGRVVGPHIVTVGVPVDGPGAKSDDMPITAVSTPAQARLAVEERDDPRVDQVKVLSTIPRIAYFTLAERARNFRIPLVGHVPNEVSAWDTVNERQKSIEHLFGVALACSSEEEALRRARADAVAKGDPAARLQVAERVLATYSPDRARKFFAECARLGTWHTPTLVQLRRLAHLDVDRLASHPDVRQVPASVRTSWPDLGQERDRLSPALLDYSRRDVELSVRMLADLRAAGARILAGTDAGDPWLVPGSSLHDELALLVEAGFTPLEALRSATLGPAAFLRKQSDHGAIAKGKLADLILLDANPLADIRNTRRISTVILGGVVQGAVSSEPINGGKPTTVQRRTRSNGRSRR